MDGDRVRVLVVVLSTTQSGRRQSISGHTGASSVVVDAEQDEGVKVVFFVILVVKPVLVLSPPVQIWVTVDVWGC